MILKRLLIFCFTFKCKPVKFLHQGALPTFDQILFCQFILPYEFIYTFRKSFIQSTVKIYRTFRKIISILATAIKDKSKCLNLSLYYLSINLNSSL